MFLFTFLSLYHIGINITQILDYSTLVFNRDHPFNFMGGGAVFLSEDNFVVASRHFLKALRA